MGHIELKPTGVSERRAIQSSGAPAAIGPYSQAIVAEGRFVFCSGQIALDPHTGALVGAGDVVAQTRRVMENLRAVVEAAGSSLDRVLRTTVYLVSLSDFGHVNEVYGSFFSGEPPARATVGVASLPRGALVEIDAIALV